MLRKALHGRHVGGPPVRVLLDVRADIHRASAAGATALLLACREGSARCAEMLLDAGASAELPDAVGATPLVVGAAGGHVDVVTALLRRGVRDVEWSRAKRRLD